MSGESRRLLVVDDSESARKSLRDALEHRGHHVTESASALGAIHEINSQEPDLLITDLHMPGMDGLQLVMNVRKGGSECPVVVITAEPSKELAEAGKRLGVAAWVRKPFDPGDLCEAIELLTESSKH